MISKMEIGLSLSRNFNKVTLSFQDEPIEHSNEEELVTKIREKFKLLRAEIEKEFGNEQIKPDIAKNEPEKATEKQLDYLEALNFKGNKKDLTKDNAINLIKKLLNEAERDY